MSIVVLKTQVQHITIEFTRHNMATLNIEMYLQKQTQMYQHILQNTANLKQTIKYQNMLKQNKTIPKQYLSRPLKTFGTTLLNETFTIQYGNLFFQHLDKVLIHNQTSLELQQTKLTNIIADTERQLNMSTESTDKIRQYYYQFLTNNNITNHETLPILKAKLTTSQTTPTTPATSNRDSTDTLNSTEHNVPATPNTSNQGPTQVQPEPSTTERPDQQNHPTNTQPTKPTIQRKRKQNETQPAKKQLKLHHFLHQSLRHNPPYT